MGLSYLHDDLTDAQKDQLPALRAFLEQTWDDPKLRRSREALLILASHDARHFTLLNTWYLNPSSREARSACASAVQDLTHWALDLKTGKYRRRTLPKGENTVVYSFPHTFTASVQTGESRRKEILGALSKAWGWPPTWDDTAPFGIKQAHGSSSVISGSFTATVNIHKDGRSSLTEVEAEPPSVRSVQKMLAALPSDEARLDFLKALGVCRNTGALDQPGED